MRGWLTLIFLIGLTSCAQAGRLQNSFTWPSFEALTTGPDTCAADTVREAGPLTAIRTWAGPNSGSDQLTNGIPGTSALMVAGVPNGTYTVTVLVRDPAGNLSCPATITQMVKGKPARIQNLGLVIPALWRDYFAAVLEDVRIKWRYR